MHHFGLRSGPAFGLLLAVFIWGVAAGAYQVFPYPMMREVKNMIDGHEGPMPNVVYDTHAKSAEIAAGLAQWGSTAEVVMVGDSLTEGGRWNEMFPNISILNRGIGGDTVGNVADRASTVLEARPRKIFLMIGLNDIFYPRNSEAQIVDQFDRVIGLLTRGEAQVFVQSIVICNSINPVCTPRRQERLRRLNAALPTLAARHGAMFIDLNARMTGDGGLRKELSWDGMHLNGQGYRVWQGVLKPYVAPRQAALPPS
ncbi:MAG: GDSL-type esterase/lipase family protein [Pseudomonadota bacterium]